MEGVLEALLYDDIEEYLIAEEGVFDKAKEKFKKMQDDADKQFSTEYEKYINPSEKEEAFLRKHPNMYKNRLKAIDDYRKKKKAKEEYEAEEKRRKEEHEKTYGPLYKINWDTMFPAPPANPSKDFDEILKYVKKTLAMWNRNSQLKSAIQFILSKKINRIGEDEYERAIKLLKAGKFFDIEEDGEFICIYNATQEINVALLDITEILASQVAEIFDVGVSTGDGDEGCIYLELD